MKSFDQWNSCKISAATARARVNSHGGCRIIGPKVAKLQASSKSTF